MKGLVVFDLDGVLIDSNEANYQAFRQGILAAGLAEPTREAVTCLIGMPALKMLQRLGCPEERCSHIYTTVVKPHYLEHLPQLARPIEQAHQVLSALLARGYRIGACTSGDRVTQEKALGSIGVRQLIEHMQTPDDSLHNKPQVRYLQELVERFPSTSNIYHVEDSEVGLQMGLDGGATTIFADYGYGRPGALQPHHRISRLSQILELV